MDLSAEEDLIDVNDDDQNDLVFVYSTLNHGYKHISFDLKHYHAG